MTTYWAICLAINLLSFQLNITLKRYGWAFFGGLLAALSAAQLYLSLKGA